MRNCQSLILVVMTMPGLWAPRLHADAGDIESSNDYDGFPRLPGYVITDYVEDNPADFEFLISRPQALDASNVETLDVKGHRYVITYQLGSGARAPSLYQTQQAYEKMAAAAGYQVKKTGATGDATETFHREKGGHDVWVSLVPGLTSNVLTIVDSIQPAAPANQPPPSTGPAPTIAPLPASDSAAASSAPLLSTSTSAAPKKFDDSLFLALSQDGRVVVPLTFLPGKPELTSAAQDEIDRVVAMLNQHPDLALRIEGHTDNAGDPEDNMRLSAERAIAVQERLIAASIDRKRLDAVGVGGLQPIATNNTADGREKNRRIELVVWKHFHAPGPNGQNYYPSGSASTGTTDRAGG